MELRHLRHFVAVAEELHFSRAAAKLHIAQPPLSLSIRTLEEELGARLFERTKRRVMLTEAGLNLLDEARAILERVARAQRHVSQVVRGAVGPLEIGFTGAVVFGDVMAPLLARFRRAWPEVHLTVEQMTTAAQLQALAERRLDIGFARQPDGELPPGIRTLRVQQEQLLVALSSDHPLCGAGRIELVALRDEPFIMPTRQTSPGLHNKVQELCASAGFSPRVVAEAHQITALVSLAAAGIGVAIVVAGMRRAAIPGLTFVEIADDHAFLDLLVISRDGDSRPTVRNFIELL